MSEPSTRPPLLAALFCVITGLLIGIVSSGGTATVIGIVIAGAALVPACYALWAGMSSETQHAVAWSILLMIASVGVSGLLILRHVVEWLR